MGYSIVKKPNRHDNLGYLNLTTPLILSIAGSVDTRLQNPL